MQDIILQGLKHKRLVLCLTSTGFSFPVVIIRILYFCATLFQLLVKTFWKNVTVWLSEINSCKSLGLPRWHEVAMDLIYGCRHYISTGMALLLSEEWRRPRCATRALLWDSNTGLQVLLFIHEPQLAVGLNHPSQCCCCSRGVFCQALP